MIYWFPRQYFIIVTSEKMSQKTVTKIIIIKLSWKNGKMCSWKRYLHYIYMYGKRINPKFPKWSQWTRDLLLLLSKSSRRPNQNLRYRNIPVVVSIMLNNYKIFANFVEILYAHKSWSITRFLCYAKNSKLFKIKAKAFCVSLMSKFSTCMPV